MILINIDCVYKKDYKTLNKEFNIIINAEFTNDIVKRIQHLNLKNIAYIIVGVEILECLILTISDSLHCKNVDLYYDDLLTFFKHACGD